MHMEIEQYKTQYFEAEVREKTLKNDLFSIRARMLDISERYSEIQKSEIVKMHLKPKSYNGPGNEFLDPEQLAKIKKREMKAMKEQEWDADNDIEAICNIYLEYLWSASTTTINELKAERLKIKIAEENKKLQAKKKKQKKIAAEDKAKDAEMQSSNNLNQTGMNTTLNSVKFEAGDLGATKTDMNVAGKTVTDGPMETVKENPAAEIATVPTPTVAK